MLRILLIDDNPDDRLLIIRALKRELLELEVTEITDPETLDSAIETMAWDLVITDYQLHWTTGLDILSRIKARDRYQPVIMCTNTGNQEIAVAGMKAGLDDYVTKSPTQLIRLPVAIHGAIDRTAIQRKAARLELRLESLLNQLSVGVFRITLSGDFVESNAAFLRLLGVDSLQQAQKYSLPQLKLQLIDQSIHQPVTQEVQLKRPNGSMIWLLLNETPVIIDGETLIDGLLEDITPLKQAEQALKQLNETLEQRVADRTAQLEEVNQELSAFAYSVSHDLQEPLRGIQGLAQALLEDYAPQLDEPGRKYAQHLNQAAQRLDTMIKDLLAYSRLSSTEVQLQPVALDVAIADALDLLSLEIANQKAQVTVEEPLPIVLGHYTILVQVVGNLISNGIKFVAPGVVPHVHIWSEERKQKIRLWIEDNGIGISPNNHKRVFRVFERLHGIETYSGNGIGLAQVRRGIERMGGTCGVESQSGQSSRFWIELIKGED